jgi:hypothetical protein
MSQLIASEIKVDTTNNYEKGSSKLNGQFYGAVFGTAAAIALMVTVFIFAPIALGATLLTVGIISILLAGVFLRLKFLILPTSHPFTEGAKNNIGYGPDTYEFDWFTNATLCLPDKTVLRGNYDKNPNNTEPSNQRRKLVIYFKGNGEGETDLESNPLFSNGTGLFWDCDLLSFSYRGTNNSSGCVGSYRQNGKDGYEIFKAALRLGYSADNIILHGHSFGGSVATLVKQQCLNVTIGDPALFASVTFSSLESFLCNKITDPIALKIVQGITRCVLWILGYNYRFTADDWNNLGTKNFCINGGSLDMVINDKMSLTRALFDENQNRTDAIFADFDHNSLPQHLKSHPADVTKIRETLGLETVQQSAESKSS